MAAVQRKLVHKQFNSPMGLYSEQNVKETLNRELKAFGNEGIEIDDQISKPLNLANSAVLRAVEEEEQIKCEPLTKCVRESRSRQRFHQRPHTPVHQQQLEQIKTQYLSHQYDITVDRDTVLKINRLATRRNLHKRDHSWPPTSVATATVTTAGSELQLNNNVVQHVRSTSHDNAVQFDETVCKRHGVKTIREKFNSPTRIIEPTAKEVREIREQQRKQQQQQHCHNRSVGGRDYRDKGVNKTKEMINFKKHEKLSRQKNIQNKSVPQQGDKKCLERFHKTEESISTEPEEDKVYQTSSVPQAKSVCHPETKAADEIIGLVEPKRQYYEQLASGKKWYSYENLLAAVNAYPTMKPMAQTSHRRQAYSLERGRDKKLHKQLPPQKPRSSPKLQRRSMKLATEIKICYDADAQQDNIKEMSLNKAKKYATEDLEDIPLPAVPDGARTATSGGQRQETKIEPERQNLKDQSTYDDSCIYLRSVDLQDNTVAYIPAAITIVPSPTEEIMQHWLESNNLKANINDLTKSDVNDTKLATHSQQTKQQQLQTQHTKKHINEMKIADPATYVTHLPSTPEGIELARHTYMSTKRNKQMNCSRTTAAEVTATANVDEIQEKCVYFTDGEYLYGPCDASNGKPLPNASVRTSKAEQQQHKIPQIRKVAEAERKNHHQQQQYAKQEVANLTAKYEHIQKSINEHLKQIDAYIENAKSALKSTLATSSSSARNTTESSSSSLPHIQSDKPRDASLQQPENQQPCQLNQQTETPLKEILRKITDIMQEVKPLSQHLNLRTETKPLNREKAQKEENMPIVDKVLMDLNLLTTHLSEFDKPTAELKPIIAQLQEQATPLNLQFETKPRVCQPSYVVIDDVTAVEENKEIPLDKAKDQTLSQPPTPPPLPPPLVVVSSPTPKALLKTKEKQHMVADKQLLATDKKLITVQKQQPSSTMSSKLLPATSTYYDVAKKLTTAVTTLKNDKDNDAQVEEKKQNFVFDFLIQRCQQEQLTKQVIDTIGNLEENKSKENLVNIHEHPRATTLRPTTLPATNQSADGEQQVKSNLNLQTPADSAATTDTLFVSESLAQDVLVTFEKCNVNVLTNACGKVACNHDNHLKSKKGNESQLKLHIKDFADKISDKQFQKYDDDDDNDDNDNKQQKLSKNTNNVVVSSHRKSSQRQPNEHVCPQKDGKVVAIKKQNDNKIKDNKKPQQNREYLDEHKEKQEKPGTEEDDSNHSSGSELSNTYKSSYELPSPYITERQIPWQDVRQYLTPATSFTHNQSSSPSESQITTATTTERATTTVNIIKPKHDEQTVEESTESIEGLCEIAATTNLAMTATMPTSVSSTTSGHVEMQSTRESKPHMQTRKLQPHQHQQRQMTHHYEQQQFQPYALETSRKAEDLKRYSAPLIDPHIPTRASSPFGLNSVDITPNLMQCSPSCSPSRLQHHSKRSQHEELMQAIRKYPSALVEPHLPTRSTSPFGLNAVEMANISEHSKSKSPKRWHDESFSRKNKQLLSEPHMPTKATSPFAINALEINRIAKTLTRGTTPLPSNDDCDAEQQPKDNRPDSPIRKYPAALVEPHVATRVASPFGLNPIVVENKRTPSPAPASALGLQQHYQASAQEQTYPTASDSTRQVRVVYVPQLEGHNIGLLVRTTAPIPYYHSQQAAMCQMAPASFTDIKSTDTLTNISGNRKRATNDSTERDDDNYEDDDDDDRATCDELQRINAIGFANKQGITTITKCANMKQQQQQANQLRKPTHVLDEHYSHSSGDTTIPLATSIINRSYDNVSPRPYITIEGYKRVAWPPASEERIVREFTPQPQTQYQPVPAYNPQQQQHQPTAAATQPQQQQHTVSHDQVDQQSNLAQDQRGTSPGIITLRKEAPISQKPTPVYTSQPAAISFRESSADIDSLGGSNMRGDLKWPPPEYKEAAAKENEERRKLAAGPVCRPRKVHRDYTTFFAKNALSHHYPSYKVPPGTQHMIN